MKGNNPKSNKSNYKLKQAECLSKNIERICSEKKGISLF